MVSATVTVQNSLGLHARPISKLVKSLKGCSDTVLLNKGEQQANATNIYQMMALNARCGDEIRIDVNGDTENDTLFMITDLFQKKFYET